jgi:TolA-binding protein
VEAHPQHPQAAEAGLLKAELLEQRGEFDAALSTYQRVLEQFADDRCVPQALYRAARLHDRLHQSREAKQLYERLIREFPQSADAELARYHLGFVLRDLGEPQLAIRSWQTIHEHGAEAPHWREATYLLAENALEKGDSEQALSLINQLLAEFEDAAGHNSNVDGALAPGGALHARSLLLAAHIAMERGAWELARDRCAQVAQDSPGDPLQLSARFWVAEAEYRLSNFSAALGHLDDLALAAAGCNEPWVPFVALRKAQILAHQEEWVQANQAAQHAIDIHPEFELRFEAEYVLGRSLAALGQFEAARQAYERVLESTVGGQTETAARAQWMIGETYMHQREYELALSAYLRGENLFPFPEWQSLSLLQAGKCHELLGNWSEAHGIYTRLLERFPQAQVDTDAKRRLEAVARRLTSSE